MQTKASRNDEIYLNALPLIKELYAQGVGFNKIAAKVARGLNKTNLRRRLIADGIHVVNEQ